MIGENLKHNKVKYRETSVSCVPPLAIEISYSLLEKHTTFVRIHTSRQSNSSISLFVCLQFPHCFSHCGSFECTIHITIGGFISKTHNQMPRTVVLDYLLCPTIFYVQMHHGFFTTPTHLYPTRNVCVPITLRHSQKIRKQKNRMEAPTSTQCRSPKKSVFKCVNGNDFKPKYNL